MKAASASKTKKARTVSMICAEVPGDNPEYFVGIDLHKKFMQVALMNSDGKILQNKRVECDLGCVAKEFSSLSHRSLYLNMVEEYWR